MIRPATDASGSGARPRRGAGGAVTGVGALFAGLSVMILGERYSNHPSAALWATMAGCLVPLVEIVGKVFHGFQRRLLVGGSGGAMRASVPYPEARTRVPILRWGGAGAWGLSAFIAYSGGPVWMISTVAAAALSANFLSGFHNDPAAGL